MESGYQVSSVFFVLSPAELVVVFNMVSFKVRNSVLNSVADPGEGPGGPGPPSLFSDQNEARRAEKIFFGGRPPPPLISGSG